MSLWTVQLAQNPSGTDFAFVNCSTVDIPAGTAVIIDSTNALGSGNTTNVDGIAIALPSADGQQCVGVTMEIIKARGGASGTPGAGGRVRCYGPIVAMTAAAAITAGAVVMNETVTGNAKAQTAAKAQLGIALTTAVGALDPVMVMLGGAFNA